MRLAVTAFSLSMIGLSASLHAASPAGPTIPASAVAPGDEARVIKETLEHRLPEARIEAVIKSSIPGLYEVVFPTEIAYTVAGGDALFLGHMVDTRSRQDLGQARWNELHAVPFASLPLDLAIKSVHGNGQRQLAVFADPLCPYCQQLEQGLAHVDDVTIYTFLFPLESVHPGATTKAHAIWCAPDRSQAWEQWMLKKVEPAPGSCASDPVPTLGELGMRLDVSMTPTLLFADGGRSSGVLSSADIERRLQGPAATMAGGRPAPATP